MDESHAHLSGETMYIKATVRNARMFATAITLLAVAIFGLPSVAGAQTPTCSGLAATIVGTGGSDINK